MLIKALKLIFLVIVVNLLMSFICNKYNTDQVKGGECIYNKTAGVAIITSISDAPLDSNNCPNHPQVISFTFVPDNKDASKLYLFPNHLDINNNLTIHDGKNPSKVWAERNNIFVGKKINCYRKEITKGTCTPVIFEFEGVDVYPETYCE